MYQLIEIYFFICLLSTAIAKPSIRDWEFEIVDVESESENPELFNIDLEATRFDRDDYRVSGNFDINIEFTDEECMMIEIYKSVTGSSDYKKTPFRFPKSTLSTVMNDYYKPLLMPVLKECAPKAPQIQGRFKPPLKPVQIVANNCIADVSNYPPIADQAYYKFAASFWGQANATLVITVRVTKKVF